MDRAKIKIFIANNKITCDQTFWEVSYAKFCFIQSDWLSEAKIKWIEMISSYEILRLNFTFTFIKSKSIASL